MSNARRSLVSLIAASALSCTTVALAQTTAKPPAKPTTTARSTRPATAPARSDPFIGVWRLSAEKSKYENGRAPAGFTRTYEDRGGGTIFMTTEVAGEGSTTRSYLVYKRDGTAYPEAAIGVESIRMVTVTSINRSTEQLAFGVAGKPGDNATTITVSVSPDGRTMTQVLSGKTSQGRTFTNTLVFDKQ